MKDIIDLVARFCLSAIFIFEAYDSISFFGKTKNTMSAYGIEWNQDFLLSCVVTVLIFGAILILIGYYANIGAFLVLLYMIPITFIVYSFWNDPKDVQRIQSIMFMKNISIAGGFLMIVAMGGGAFALDNRLNKKS